jgi:hypothetical protein
MKKYADLIKILEELFGKGAVSRTIGTRTNVVRFPKGKQGLNPTKSEFDVEGSYAKNPDLVQTIENSIEDRMGDITQMNDQELLTYTANARRLLNFKKPPELPNADVIKFGSGEEIKGKGLETLIEKQGTRFPPTTDIGRLEAAGKRLEKFAEEMSPEFLAKQEAERRALLERQYEGKGFAGGVFGPSGMYRAVARDFLLDQNTKGKIKLSPDTIKNLEDRNYISGGQPLMYADPIRIMRYHYGDDIFEKIPLDKIPTGARSEIIDVMSKVEAPPIRTEAPKTPGGYLTPGEYRANIEEMQRIEDTIKRRESRFADMTEEEIQNELQQYGSKRSAFEMGLESDFPEEYAKYKGPKKPEPEEKADGGRIGYSGGSKLEGILDVVKKDYDKSITKKIIDKGDEINETVADALRRQIESRLTDEQRKKMNRFLGIRDATINDLIKDSNSKGFAKDMKRKEEVEEADGGRIGFSKGKKVMSEIDKLIEQLNKKTKGKKSMESVNPKTGEVTVPKRPIRRAEEPTGTTVMDPEPEIVDERVIAKNKSRQLTKEEIEDYSEQLGDTETWLSEGTVEEAEKALKRMKDQEAYYYGQYKMGKLDPAPGEQTEARMKFLQKKLEEASEVKDRRLITPKEIEELKELESRFIYKKGDPITEENFASSPFAPSQETLDNLKKAREQSKKMSEQELENEMNRVLNQYDKSMFIKNEQGLVDVTNEKNQKMMAELLRRDHPELYNQIYNLGEDLSQKQILDEFDITGREPNANGGIAGLL